MHVPKLLQVFTSIQCNLFLVYCDYSLVLTRISPPPVSTSLLMPVSPSASPTASPSTSPTKAPNPTTSPTQIPTAVPTNDPTDSPTAPCGIGKFGQGGTDCKSCPVNTYSVAGSTLASDCQICPFRDGRCQGGAGCRDAYTGMLCSVCAPRHYYHSDQCSECRNINIMGSIAFVVIIIIMVFIIWRLHATGWKQLAALKQILNYSQNINICNSINVPWPSDYMKLMEWFKLLNFNLDSTSPECYSDNITWHLKFIVVGGIFGLFVLSILCVIISRRRHRGRGNAPAKSSTVLQQILVLGFTAGYASVVTVCMQAFQRTDDHKKFVYEPLVPFWSTEHMLTCTYAGILLGLAMFGLPLFFFGFVRHLRNNNLLRKPETRAAYGSLYDAYKDERVDFEVYSILRRGLALAFVIPYRNTPTVQAGSQLVLSVIFFIMLVKWKPYAAHRLPTFRGCFRWIPTKKIDTFNHLEIFSTIVHIIIQGTALLLALTWFSETTAFVSIAIGSVLFALVLVCHAYICMRMVIEATKKQNTTNDTTNAVLEQLETLQEQFRRAARRGSVLAASAHRRAYQEVAASFQAPNQEERDAIEATINRYVLKKYTYTILISIA